jgi:hypothetical protein
VARLSKQRRQELAAGRGGSAPRPAATPSRRRVQQVKVPVPWWQSPWAWGSGVTVAVVAVVVVFIVLATQAPAPAASPDPLMPSSVVSAVTGVSPSTLATVGAGGLSDPLTSLPSSTPKLTGSDGHPEVLYIGEDTCPFCAFERWSVVVALSRFGTFSDLHQTTSSDTEDVAEINLINSFSFYGATYSSSYIDFQGVEVDDRNGNPLQTPTAAQNSAINTYGDGGYPFLDVGGRYVGNGDPSVNDTVDGQTVTAAPELIYGMTWAQIASSLSQPDTVQAQAILGNANFITAAICKVTNNRPASVCGTSTISQLEGELS